MEHNELTELGDQMSCTFWNFSSMSWSSSGCQYNRLSSNRKLSVCECDHLTNFAALMDVSGRQTNTKAKEILTDLFCGISIICLIATIGIFATIKEIRNRRAIITCNLCVCLLVVNLLVVFGMDRTEHYVSNNS